MAAIKTYDDLFITNGEYVILDWKYVLGLQIPIQLLIYSVVIYVAGLAMYVLWPMRMEWGDDCKVGSVTPPGDLD